MMSMAGMSAARPALKAPHADDRYPSRVGTEAIVSPRLDSVVYPQTGTGPLSTSELRFYEDRG